MVYLKRDIWGDVMAKKKSKTQKLKKNQKTKQKKVQKKVLEQTAELKKIKDSGAVSAPSTKKAIKTPKKPKANGQKKLVEKEKVNYNVALTTNKMGSSKTNGKKSNINNKKKTQKNNQKPKVTIKDKVLKQAPIEKEEKLEPTTTPKEEIIVTPKEEKLPKKTEIKPKIKAFFLALITAIAVAFKKIGINTKEGLKNHKKNKTQKQARKELKKLLNQKQEETIIIEEDTSTDEEEIDKEELKRIKQQEKKEKIKKKNIFIRLIYDILCNRHIFFNAVLILFFIVLFIGLKRIEISKGTIFYISIISIFLMAVAISYNKYLSGKLFTILLCAIMGFAIYRIQYTYDFIRNLNSTVYEYKTYYVVTFNNTQNKSIYNINNKKVGLYNDNTINIERKLNTKLDEVNYIEYDDLNDLFNDFYNQKFRAVLVNENQYKYMKNFINSNARDVKILYEFKANAKK